MGAHDIGEDHTVVPTNDFAVRHPRWSYYCL